MDCCSFQIENVVLEIPFPKSVLNVTLAPTQGKYSFDPVNKVMTWDVGKIDPSKLPSIKGSVSLILPRFIKMYTCSNDFIVFPILNTASVKCVKCEHILNCS